MDKQPRQEQSPLRWRNSSPVRPRGGTWYFVQDNTVPDFQLHLQKFRRTGHGQVRCSSPTRWLLDRSPTAQRLMIGHYGAAEAASPDPVFVDVTAYATGELRRIRRIADPNVQLREAMTETLRDLTKASRSGKDLTVDQKADLVAKYHRIRDRFTLLRAEFTAMESELEQMETAMIDILGRPNPPD